MFQFQEWRNAIDLRMRNLEKREERNMADKPEDLPLDRVQVMY